MQSSQAEIKQQNQQLYCVTGTVDFSTVPALLQQTLVYFSAAKKAAKKAAKTASAAEGNDKITIDLASVSACNSAALALLLETVKQGQQNSIQVRFKNLPETLLSIARAYGVENEIRELCE